mmetsp:Transcript_149450/g.461372  ORF Transcript_149450/g.461372 Transcript_149450/m.461372 type:complete len:244 (+) Transcript_149450:607-1338(+)
MPKAMKNRKKSVYSEGSSPNASRMAAQSSPPDMALKSESTDLCSEPKYLRNSSVDSEFIASCSKQKSIAPSVKNTPKMAKTNTKSTTLQMRDFRAPTKHKTMTRNSLMSLITHSARVLRTTRSKRAIRSIENFRKNSRALLAPADPEANAYHDTETSPRAVMTTNTSIKFQARSRYLQKNALRSAPIRNRRSKTKHRQKRLDTVLKARFLSESPPLTACTALCCVSHTMKMALKRMSMALTTS